MKYIIDLKGLTQANVQVNGVALFLKDGQEVSEVVAKAIPRFIKEVADEINVDEVAEELLTEISEPVEVEITETKKSRKSKK